MTTAALTEQLICADAEIAKGKYSEAEKLTNEVLEELHNQSPSQANTALELLRAKAILSLATIAWRLGKYDMAIEQAKRVLALTEEHGIPEVEPKTYNILGAVHRHLGKYDMALEYLSKALEGNEKLGDKSSAARVTGNIGNVYYSLGSYDKALEYLSKALAVHEELGEKSQVAMVTGNLGIVYNFLGIYDKALEYYSTSLAVHQELGEKSLAARVTGNIGIVYYSQSIYEKAAEYFSKALSVHEELGEKSGVASVTGNLGNVYFNLGMYDKALEYLLKALAVHEELGEKTQIASVTSNIGTLYSNQKFIGYDSIKAEEYMLKAIALSEEIGAKHTIYSAHKTLADFYKTQKRWEESCIYLERYYEIEKEVKSEEAQKLAEKYDNERRNAEREKSLAVERALLKATNDILANILPPNITKRLLRGEKKIAESHKNVSVLFIDIVGFTQFSAKLSAEEVIDILDIVFTRFDTICKKHGLEKIKTIGDAYMAVCGAPIACEDHLKRTVQAAFEMLEDVEIEQKFSSPIKLDFRVGLHSGSVVAGIIGENKYAYDLWGDAVNTASRMESHGEAGKIHVSEDVARQLTQTIFQGEGFSKSDVPPSFSLGEGSDGILVERGEIEIKGKGKMRTYFLEKA